MSATIEQCLRERECGRLKFRPRLGFTGNTFAQRIYGDEFLISRLTLEKELKHHTGCVNSLYWSQTGDKLLSGSDDTRVCIWKPWEDYSLGCSIDTGHSANIFSAKFMPATSDSVVISAAADSEVRVFDVNGSNNHGQLRHVYTCHSASVKRIAIDNSPFEFMTCAEDGTVRHFDLRQRHVCSPHTISSFLGGRQPSRRYDQPRGRDVKQGCPSPLVDYSEYDVELNSMSLNPLHPQYFIIAGKDDFIYLHDRRMVGQGDRGGANVAHHAKSRCVKRFTSSSDHRRRRARQITACKFNGSNGRELIGSWLSDGIYLFDMHDSPIERSPVNTARSSSQPKSTNRDEVPFSGRNLVIQRFREGELNDAIVEIDNLLAKTDESLGAHDDNTTTEENMIEKIWELCMMSAVRLRRIYEGRASQFADEELRGEEVASTRLFIREAEAVAVDIHCTRGYWCLAVGLWIASGGQRSNGCEDRKDWLEKAQVYLEEARAIYTNALSSSSSSSSNSSSSSSSLSSGAESSLAAFNKKIDTLQRDIIAALHREEEEDDDDDTRSETTTMDRWKWLDSMYMQPMEEDTQPSKSRQSTGSPGNDGVDATSDAAAEHSIRSTSTSRHATIASSASERPASDSETSNMDIEISNENDESNSDTQHSDNSTVVTIDTQHDHHPDSHESSSSSTSGFEGESDISMGEDTDEDISEDDEYEESNPYYDEDDHEESDEDDDATSLRSISELEPDVDIIAHRKKYVGHCNVRTIKDVNFYGLNDEYIVSGSDYGYIFIWDKKTARIVQILQGDEDTVNIVQGHPRIPVIATSGIENTIKIFSPTSAVATTSRKQHPNLRSSYSESSRMYEADDIVTRMMENNVTTGDHYFTRRMLSSITRQFRRGGNLDDVLMMDDDDDEMHIDCRVQ
ncbi:hypothetical protein O0I10_011831 [Lichtheimia ornata]|uniref:Uncharacterized protein n=1 Tax=Lichtheimia ornata TaxID=688661 RepID=A0AAD7XWD1_9FUNG|nr:uncharacterized protein O0I10_011831 [Lichtheimia ornata]KAJ8652507.1 hypothetical protein O0I10_011831 [Lichtheimia ornata]